MVGCAFIHRDEASMQKDEMRHFARILAQLRALLDGPHLTTEVLEGWWQVLRDLSLRDVEEACLRAARECERWPRPARIRRYVAEKRAAMQVELQQLEARRPVLEMEYWEAQFTRREKLAAAEQQWADHLAQCAELRARIGEIPQLTARPKVGGDS
jgi:hypothetical protein